MRMVRFKKVIGNCEVLERMREAQRVFVGKLLMMVMTSEPGSGI